MKASLPADGGSLTAVPHPAGASFIVICLLAAAAAAAEWTRLAKPTTALRLKVI